MLSMRISKASPEGAGGSQEIDLSVMDSEEIALQSLKKEEADYVKTPRSSWGKSSNSDSWLEF